MASTEYDSRSRGGQEASGWAVGGLVFAASILILIGVFQIIAGLVAVFNDEFFVVARNYTFHLDVTAWGWLHLIFGVLMMVVGMGLFGRRRAHAGDAQRGVELLLPPVLPALGDRRDRPRRVGDLGADAPRRGRELIRYVS